MALYRGHPKDGKKRYDYIDRKVDHLRRIGLVSGKSTGIGFNGGAAPDHLVSEQKEERRRNAERRSLEYMRAAS